MSVLRNLRSFEPLAAGRLLEEGMKEPTYENVDIPESFGPVSLIVDDHKVKRFCFTQDEYHPWYWQRSPFGTRIGPPGLLANDLLQLFTLRYAASQVIGLHTEETMWFENPVPVGELVVLEGRYTDRYVEREQGKVVMEAEAYSAEGTPLVRHRGVEIMRTMPGEVTGRSTAPPSARRRVAPDYDATLPEVLELGATVTSGMRLAPVWKEVTPEQAAVFSRLGEFVENIHNNLYRAREGGLNSPIVQGQQLFCFVADLLARRYGATWFTSGWLQMKFVKPVQVGEFIEVSGVVHSIERCPQGERVIEVDVWICGDEGEVKAVGWAQGMVPSTAATIARIPNQ